MLVLRFGPLRVIDRLAGKRPRGCALESKLSCVFRHQQMFDFTTNNQTLQRPNLMCCSKDFPVLTFNNKAYVCASSQ